MYKKLTYLLMLLLSVSSLANDKKPLNESTVFNETFSWQAQAGFSFGYASSIIDGVEQHDLTNYINISLLLDFYYKGFFIQTDHRRADTHTLGAELGYQLLVKEDWELDIINKSYLRGFNSEDLIKYADENIPILEGLKTRRDVDGLAIRYSRYYDNSILSIDIATVAPVSAAEGWIADLFYSHIVPYRNWDIYLNAGLTYYSQDVVDYYIGVDADEISPLREEFRASHAMRAQFEIFAQRPISQSWTFNVGLSQSLYTHNITQSPIVNQQDTTQIMAGVLYVF